MNLLQRYILAELLRVFGLLVVVLTIMLVFVGLLSEAADRGLGPNQVLQIMPFVVPSMLPFTIPATLLLAVTVVYGRMAGDLEVTAAKAAGVSPLKLLRPAFVLGIILAIGSFSLTNYAIPWAIDNIERIITQAMEDIFLDVLSAQHYISEPQKGYSITVEDVRDRVLINPTFRYRNGDHEQVTMNARLAKINFDMEKKQVLIRLKDAHGSIPGRDAGGWIDERELAFPLDERARDRKSRHMTISRIRERMQDVENDDVENLLKRDQEAAFLMLTGNLPALGGRQIREYHKNSFMAEYLQRRFHTEIHSRYAMACSCLFFAFVGGPFAMLQARRQFITSFIMCFLPILLVYYPVTFLMVNLCKNGNLNPAWAMWTPNLLLLLAGSFILRQVVRH
ncbi:MAG: LptF/LptG family permease [Planctomycetaceae bacterium]|nr:LptF/LptG family permease [Planctomycetaceae bacterium]